MAEADLKAARERIALAGRSGRLEGGVRIDSPETAIVQDVHVSQGQAVAAGAPLIDLVRLDTVWVRVPVYVGEAATSTRRARAMSVLGEPADAEACSRSYPRTAVRECDDGRR